MHCEGNKVSTSSFSAFGQQGLPLLRHSLLGLFDLLDQEDRRSYEQKEADYAEQDDCD